MMLLMLVSESVFLRLNLFSLFTWTQPPGCTETTLK